MPKPAKRVVMPTTKGFDIVLHQIFNLFIKAQINAPALKSDATGETANTQSASEPELFMLFAK